MMFFFCFFFFGPFWGGGFWQSHTPIGIVCIWLAQRQMTTGEGEFVMICHKYNLGRKIIVVLNSSYVIECFFNVCKAAWFWSSSGLPWHDGLPQENDVKRFRCIGLIGLSVAECLNVHSYLERWSQLTNIYVLYFFYCQAWLQVFNCVYHSWRLVQVSVFLQVLHSDTGHHPV